MENNNPETKVYSAGYAGTFHGSSDFSTEYSCFYEKEPDGAVGSSNLYVLASGIKGTSFPEVSARFTAKKILYEYFHSYDYVDANKLALAMRTANNEIYEYAKVQSDSMESAAIAAAVTDGKVAIATVGGCRAYIIRNGKVFQITEDPQPVEDDEQSGQDNGTGGEKESIPVSLGKERDITTDVYDGIDVHGGDTLLLCSASLDTFIGKKEILEAVENNSPRTIVQQLLGSSSLDKANVPASVAAIRVYEGDQTDNMIRVDGDSPEDTDLNLEKKEVEMIRKNRPRTAQAENGEKKKKDKLPLIIILVLLVLMLLAGGVWAAARYGIIPEEFRAKYLGNLVQPIDTPTPTVDWVRESMTVYEITAEAEKAAAVAATVAAWPTQTPYPTFTPVFIDLEETQAVIRETAVAEIESQYAANEKTAEVSNETDNADITSQDEQGENADGQPTSTPYPTLAPEVETSETVVKEDYIDERSGVEMVYIPAGNFMLGSNLNEDPYADEAEEAPQLRVYLDGYWIGKTEVTNEQYLRCAEAGVCDQGYYMSLYQPGLEKYPVTYVTVEQAERFCSWIGGHLPTEYQWEKAARGTDGRIYPWGSEEPDYENALANIPNYVDENGYGNDLFEVGSFPKGESPYGLMDMAGNVWEWTNTWYSTNYYQTLQAEAELSGTTVSNPVGPENGSSRVMRGGSCASTEVNNFAAYMRAAGRSYLSQSSSYYVGFRCIVPDTGDAMPNASGASDNIEPDQPDGPRPGEPGPRP